MADLSLAPLLCATCAGSGFSGGSRCPACRGVGSALFYDGQALTWGLRLDSFAILERRTETAVRGMLNFVALVFGVLGFALLVWDAYDQGFEKVATAEFWVSGRARVTVFWITAWIDLYLAHRLIRESLSVAPIPTVPYQQNAAPGAPRPMTFEEFEKTPRAARRDISRSFSPAAIKSIESAYGLAERQSHAAVGGVHVFVGLLSAPDVGYVFQRIGLKSQTLQSAFVAVLEREAPRTGALIVSPEAYRSFYGAYLDALGNREETVTPIALFSALVRESEPVLELLDRAGSDIQTVTNVVAWVRTEERMRQRYRSGRRAARLRRKGPVGKAMTGIATPFLDRYAEDLTEAARVGGFMPIVGREAELNAVFRVVEGGRRSVLLVGERGTGKDMLLNSIAERMVEEAVPAVLSDKRLLALSVPKLIAGADPAEVAARFERIFFEIVRSRNVVLALPGVASLVGITVGSEGRGLDISEVLAQAVGKGAALLIATATPEEAAQIVRSPLAGTFETVTIDPPEINQAIQMVEAHVGYSEYQHRVVFSYSAVARAVELADRYLRDKALPEKGIEIMREAAAAVRAKRGERATVTAEDVAEVVAEKSKIPVAAVGEDESAKLMRLEESMHERVVGQDEAVKAIASAVRRARAELRSEKRPIANFLFLGPTGVGKTELAKTLAAVYFGDEERMIRLDMSEYQTTEAMYRLVGAPGSTTGGLLTEAVRRQPFSLVLLDELEKAHPDILNVFLQVMEDGRLTDATGRVADFTNAIIIATSNAGTPVIQDEIQKGTDIQTIKQRLVEKELKGTFRPEFLNRFDGIVVFKPLNQDEILEVARRMLTQIGSRLEAKGIHLQVSEEAAKELAAAGFDPAFGARPLRRVIQERVEDALATFLLQNKLGRRDTVVLEAGGALRVVRGE